MTPLLAILWLLATAATIWAVGLGIAAAASRARADKYWSWVEMMRGERP